MQLYTNKNINITPTPPGQNDKPNSNTNTNTNSNPTIEEEGGYTWVWIVIGCIILGVIIGVVVYLYCKKKAGYNETNVGKDNMGAPLNFEEKNRAD